MYLSTGAEPLTQPVRSRDRPPDDPQNDRTPHGRGLKVALVAALLCAISIAIRWPGVAMYDSVSQFGQTLDGSYTDWHPPIMARTWALLNHLHAGTQPFFVLQLVLWWGGLGLIAGGLARRGRSVAAAAILLVGALPLFLDWTSVVLKDAQMACCLVAAVGIVAHFRLGGRPLSRAAVGAAVLLIAYATLVRGNAVFATVPLGFALIGWGGVRGLWARGAVLVGLVGAVISLGPFVNHRLLGAEPTQVEHTLPLYDMAGVAHFAGLATLPGLAPAEWRRAERAGCYSPYFWNPYGEEAQCGFVGDAVTFNAAAPAHPMRRWAVLVAAHPLAYLAHRARHLNSNLRFWVGAGEGDAVPPLGSEPNALDLGGPAGPGARMLTAAATATAASPLGWPCVWLGVALALLWAARGQGEQAALGRALALSAACMSGSFAVVSIASDLRYHLWSMVAAALALILLVDAGALDRRRARIGGGLVLALAAVAGLAHLGFAPPVCAPLPPRPPAHA